MSNVGATLAVARFSPLVPLPTLEMRHFLTPEIVRFLTLEVVRFLTLEVVRFSWRKLASWALQGDYDAARFALADAFGADILAVRQGDMNDTALVWRHRL